MDIAFYDAKPYDRRSFDEENQSFGFHLKYFKSHLSKDNAVLAKGAKAVCLFVNDIVDKEVMDLLAENGVELIALRCAGYNNIDLHAAQGKIKVVRVPAYSPYAVADHTIGLILSLNRKIHRAYYRTRDGNFNIDGLLGFDLRGKTIGVIGTGKIGQVFIHTIQGFGMNVLAYDPYPNKALEETYPYMKYASLKELYQKSDIISLHCPLTEQTHHIINERSIAQMKDQVMIINTSRGGLIETRSLIRGLKSGKIGAAGLDVYEEESDYFFEDHSSELLMDDVLARLLTFNNVLITSHQAFFTNEALHNIAHTTLKNIADFRDGLSLANEVKLG